MSSVGAKAPTSTSTHLTMAGPTQHSTSTVRHIAPKVNIAPALTGQTVQLAAAQVRNIVTAEQHLAPKLSQQGGGVQIQQQQQRVIVPALAPNMSQLSSTSTNIQFPHGVISGGVVYLPQVSSTQIPVNIQWKPP